MKTRIVYSAIDHGINKNGYPYRPQYRTWFGWNTWGQGHPTLDKAKEWLTIMSTKDKQVWP